MNPKTDVVLARTQDDAEASALLHELAGKIVETREVRSHGVKKEKIQGVWIIYVRRRVSKGR